MSCPCKKKKRDVERFKSELKSRDLCDDIIEILISEGFTRLSHVRGLEVEDLDKFRNQLNRAQFVILRTKIKEKWDKLYDNENDSGSSADSEEPVNGKNAHAAREKIPKDFKSQLKRDANEAKQNSSQESTKPSPRESGVKADGSNTSEREPVIEEVEQPDGLLEHFECDLAKNFFKQRNYEAMERVLVKIDEKTKSPLGRGRFATKISHGCNDFAELHDCINHQMTDIDVMHDLTCQQFISLAESHREILQEMGLETKCNTFSEWAKLSEVVFRQNSTLEYGSFEWQKVISKTKELAQFFTSLPIPARNVSKSYILLILQFTCRVWMLRNHILAEDRHGLLRIATFCLPLCESDLVTSKYYCEVKHDVYVHAAITLGCNISNSRLDVETFYDEFGTLKYRSEQHYDEGLKLQKDVRSEDDTRNLTRFTNLVEARWAAYISNLDTEDDSELKGRDADEHHDEHHELTERHVNRIMTHWSCKSYSEFRQSIIDAEDVLKETHFKLQLGSLLSPRYNQIRNALNGSYKQMANSHALLETLHSNVMDLVIDCKRFLKELKVYSNDAMAEWVEVFFGFCSDDCIYGSAQWKGSLTRGQIAVDDTTRGVDTNGRAIMQLYVQLIVELVMEAFVLYERIDQDDRLGHVRLAAMNMTMAKSPLLTNKWYSTMRYNVYICGLRSLAACIQEDDPPAKDAFYEGYKDVKEIMDKLVVDCRKLKVPFASKQDKYKLRTLHKEVEGKMFGVPEPKSKSPNEGTRRKNLIASDPKVSRLVESAVTEYLKGNFDKMTDNLDSAEKEDGSCDVRLAFAGNMSTNFSLVLTFSNNIPESEGLHVVEETTKKNLLYLANDHHKVMTHMGEKTSDAMKELIVALFEQTNAKPGTDDWKLLKNKALEMVIYYEGLTANGHSVTKAYILLYLTVLHNFIATRNRLRRGEHCKIIPFIMPCVIICESKLLISDAWIKTKFDVYEIIVLETGASLGTGQIPCAPRFPKYSGVLHELTEKAAECRIYVCNDNQQRQIDKVRRAGFEFYRGSEDRMCIAAALIYYKAGCYRGLMGILNAADQTASADNIRMNFAMQVSNAFEKCVDYHNEISNESTFKELVKNSYFYLCAASKDFTDFVQKMGEKSSNDLNNWVDEIFQVTNGQPSLDPILELKSVAEKGQRAAQYILRLSEEARCVAQTYLSFFMSFIMNYVTRRYVLYKEDAFNGGLTITLAVIILCKDVLVTSNFSIKQKQKSYSVAATYMTKVKDESKVWTSEMETVVNELGRLKELRKEFEEICKRRAATRKDWPSDVQYEDTQTEPEEKKRQAATTCERGQPSKCVIEKVNNDFSSTFQENFMEAGMRKEILLKQNEEYKHEEILPWDVFSKICLQVDICNDACLDWRSLAEKMGVSSTTIEIWQQKNVVNPTKTMLLLLFSENVQLPREEMLKKLYEMFQDSKLGHVAELVSQEIKRTGG